MSEKKKLQQLIDSIKADESLLVFPEFTHATALELGLALHEEAKRRGAAVTIDIRKGKQILFHVAMEGTSANNDRWVERKSNTVQMLQKSSFRVGRELVLKGATLPEREFLDFSEYADHGGSFPVRVRGAGVIGAVTVSGLPQEEDHALVRDVLREFLRIT